ncbi:hypothetical protein ACQ4PT_009188 [Festuca glaucescens]
MELMKPNCSRRSRTPPGPLPLITCPRCGNIRIRCWVSSTDANPGIRFYKCPNQRAGEDTCDSWWWEDEYAAYITGTGLNLLIAAAGGTLSPGRAGGIRETIATAPTTWCICVLILIAQAMKMLHDRI